MVPNRSLEGLIKDSLTYRVERAEAGVSINPTRISQNSSRQPLGLMALFASVICTVLLVFSSNLTGEAIGAYSRIASLGDGDSERLTGVRWSLDTLSVESGDVLLNSSHEAAFIEFGATSYYMYDTCNGASGSYSTDSGTLIFNEGYSAMMGCDKPEVDTIRGLLAPVSSEPTTFTVSGDTLTLRGGMGLVATFRDTGLSKLALN